MDQQESGESCAFTRADVSGRREAVRRLAQAESWDAESTLLLVDAVEDDDDEVRDWATEALERLGQPAAETIEALQERLNSSHQDRAYWAATLLGRLGPAGRSAVQMLRQTLTHSHNPAVRERAVWALGQMGAAAREALPELRQIAVEDTGRLSRLAQNACHSIESG